MTASLLRALDSPPFWWLLSIAAAAVMGRVANRWHARRPPAAPVVDLDAVRRRNGHRDRRVG